MQQISDSLCIEKDVILKYKDNSLNKFTDDW